MPESNATRREVGDLAIWTLSSAKQGNGVEQLRDNQVSTFWQSDGQQPHSIRIQFLKKMKIKEIGMYLDFKTDESYTPQKIAIRVMNSFMHMQDLQVIEFDEPIGWYIFTLNGNQGIKTREIEIAIL